MAEPLDTPASVVFRAFVKARGGSTADGVEAWRSFGIVERGAWAELARAGLRAHAAARAGSAVGNVVDLVAIAVFDCWARRIGFKSPRPERDWALLTGAERSSWRHLARALIGAAETEG